MQPPTDSVLSSNEFKDRRTGLVIFGVLTILLGGLCALFILLMLFGQAMAAKAGSPSNGQMIAPALVMYGGLAVVLVWLGIGSMMARRWARALLLIFSSSWLAVGVFAFAFMSFVLPQFMESINAANPPGQAELPAAAKALMWVIPMIVLAVVYVILPIAWVLFYRSRHVKATCEALDPVERWTDRCPLPVIAVSLWLAFSAPMMLMMAVVYKGVLPVFGTFVVGPAGSALCVLLALLWGYSAWALYKLDIRGWWIVVASVIIFSISAFITYSRHDLMELYSLLGYPEEQIAQLQKFTFFKKQTMAWLSIIGAGPLLAYLFYVRKFFAGVRQ
ncbi:MAG: hypothetical protein QOE70_1860 [Chthoniobacter sp.]|jgi:hypothetical protein|nr:hypothetical protein [Chthoniobacter sp.]